MQLQPDFRCSSLNALDPGSGRGVPAICHDTGVWHDHLPHNPSTENGHVQAGVALLAWFTQCHVKITTNSRVIVTDKDHSTLSIILCNQENTAVWPGHNGHLGKALYPTLHSSQY